MENKSFENCPKKRAVHRAEHDDLCKRGITGGYLMLSGSFPERPIKQAERIAGNPLDKIYCIEMDRGIYDKTERYRNNNLNRYSKVKTAWGLIENYKEHFQLKGPLPIINADFCGSLLTNLPFLISSLEDQTLNNSKRKEVLMFNVSQRRGRNGGGLRENLYDLSKILKVIGTKIDIEYSMKEENKVSYTWPDKKHAYYKLRIKILKYGNLLRDGLHIRIYKDSSTMMSCVIMHEASRKIDCSKDPEYSEFGYGNIIKTADALMPPEDELNDYCNSVDKDITGMSAEMCTKKMYNDTI